MKDGDGTMEMREWYRRVRKCKVREGRRIEMKGEGREGNERKGEERKGMKGNTRQGKVPVSPSS
jgi:hypothetical protein